MIYASSPQTFDPFMVDLALVLTNGATLLTVDPIVRLQPALLVEALFPSRDGHHSDDLRCSIIQTTPSLFLRWSNEEMKQIFSSSTSLRILSLGGEPFPTSKLAASIDWLNDNSSRHLFNIYGLTEMSCWASIYDVTASQIRSNEEVPIGEPLDEFTKLEILPDGGLTIKTCTRKCFQPALSDEDVLDGNKEIAIKTDDVCFISGEQIFFRARSNGVVKVLGRKVDLHLLESIANAVDGVEQAVCAHQAEKNVVIFFIISNSDFEEVQRNVEKALRANSIDVIHDFCVLEHFPLSAHGKISKKELLATFERRGGVHDEDLSDALLNSLNLILGTELDTKVLSGDTVPSQKRIKTDIDASFTSLGGFSLNALNVINRLQEEFGRVPSYLLPMLLDQNVSIAKIVQKIVEEKSSERSLVPTQEKIIPKSDMKIVWALDMSKCVDAAPTLIETSVGLIVSVGSHSGFVFNISFADGRLVSYMELPDRVESQVADCGHDCAAVGCYDGKMYCFNILNGQIEWSMDSEGMIKCKPLLMSSVIVFGNYNSSKNAHAIDSESGKPIWSQQVGSKSIYANPAPLNERDCLFCSLDGAVASVAVANGHQNWTKCLKTPIFATPLVYKNGARILFIVATVDGVLRCFDEEPAEIWQYKVDGNLFSSPICRIAGSKIDFIFGSQNSYLYCLTGVLDHNTVVERWKFKTSAPIRSSSVEFSSSAEVSVLTCSSDGEIFVNDIASGSKLNAFRIDGEIFSSPAIQRSSILVGSRNNYVYRVDLAARD